MTAWILLPVSLSAFSITGLWTVYAMAVMNHHVCPVENWSYNESCSPDPTEQGGPKTCCTLDDVPLISRCGTYPPESCLFSLIGNVGAFMVALICLLRYGQLLEQGRHSWVNTTTLITGCTNAAGLVLLGNFQVDHAKALHYVGTGVAFTTGLLFVCLHCALSYHGATAPQDLAVAYLRIVLAAIAFVTLILSILPGRAARNSSYGPGPVPPKVGLGVAPAPCGLVLPVLGGEAWPLAPAWSHS